VRVVRVRHGGDLLGRPSACRAHDRVTCRAARGVPGQHDAAGGSAVGGHQSSRGGGIGGHCEGEVAADLVGGIRRARECGSRLVIGTAAVLAHHVGLCLHCDGLSATIGDVDREAADHHVKVERGSGCASEHGCASSGA
ncbi:MAG: hypothetical protein ACK56I_06995, partial [bacterium]